MRSIGFRMGSFHYSIAGGLKRSPGPYPEGMRAGKTIRPKVPGNKTIGMITGGTQENEDRRTRRQRPETMLAPARFHRSVQEHRLPHLLQVHKRNKNTKQEKDKTNRVRERQTTPEPSQSGLMTSGSCLEQPEACQESCWRRNLCRGKPATREASVRKTPTALLSLLGFTSISRRPSGPCCRRANSTRLRSLGLIPSAIRPDVEASILTPAGKRPSYRRGVGAKIGWLFNLLRCRTVSGAAGFFYIFIYFFEEIERELGHVHIERERSSESKFNG